MKPEIAQKIDSFLSRYPRQEYPKGQILVLAGSSPDHIFYITEGRVRKYALSYRNDEIVITIFRPPAFFPMSWALNHTSNRFYYKAETKVVVHIVPIEDARKFVEDNADIAVDLLSRLYRGLEGVYGRLTHLMSGTAKSRLMYEIILTCRRFGEQRKDGSWRLPVHETDMAAQTGLSRETVSREIRKLKRSGCIAVDGQSLVVLDLPQLEHMLGAEV